LFEELKQRNVFKAGAAYALISWLLLQVCAVTFPALMLPDWSLTFVTVLLVIGFPIALLLAWASDLSPEGVKSGATQVPLVMRKFLHGRQVDFAIIGLMAVVIIFLVVDNYVLTDAPARDTAPTNVVEIEEPEPPVIESTENIRQSIAVLPFVNMSDDKDYFADGLSEEILNLLAKIRDLKVIGRTSSFAYKGKNEDLRIVGEALGVSTVLEGSVRKSGTKLRITAQLIKVADGSHLWSETYDRELTDVFAIQDDVAAAIIEALHVHIGEEGITERGRPTENMEAYSLFLKATALSGVNDSAAAVPFLVKATELDPDYAEAFEFLSFKYWNQGNVELNSSLMLPLLRTNAAKALAINPEMVLANALFHWASDDPDTNFYITQTQIYEEAVSKEENNPQLIDIHVWNLLETGYFQEALHWAKKLEEIEPWATQTHMNLARTESAAGLHKEAISSLKLALSLGDEYAGGTLVGLYSSLNEYEKAVPFIKYDSALPKMKDANDLREHIVATRDPNTGVNYIDQFLANSSWALSLEKDDALNAIKGAKPYYYYVAEQFDSYYDYLNEFETSKTKWTTVGEYIADAHVYRHFGGTRHPKYLKIVEAMGLFELWDQRGAPDHCSKETGSWVCE
jgi:TolB-like protein/tetratricopeptide (TPR) repeat protein